MWEGRETTFEVARAEDLPGILQYRLRLEEPECAAWVVDVMDVLATRMPPAQAMGWWFRMHIALNGRAPIYLLPEGWTPAGSEAQWLLCYAETG